MNWDAVGAIGEIIGALAVVVSLIYLASQIRHNNQLARSNSLESVLQSEMNFGSIAIDNADIWDRLLAGESFTDRFERRKAIIIFNLFMQDSANRFFQYKTGYLQDQPWDSRKAALHNLVKLPIFRTWRESMGAKGHTEEFLRIIDRIYSEEVKDAISAAQ